MTPTYKNLKSYQQAVTICDLTVEFCKKYINYKSRTTDQMIQAARSGKQNIVEGCSASKHNPQTEIKLLGVARASFEELLEDYHDFLRQNKLSVWSKDDPRSLELRRLAYKQDMSDKTDRSYKTDKTDKTDKTYTTYKSDKTYSPYETYHSYLENPEKIGNAMITLINQTNYLLDQQIKGVKKENDSTGVVWESHNQKLSRLQVQNLAKERKDNEWLKALQEKYKKEKAK